MNVAAADTMRETPMRLQYPETLAHDSGDLLHGEWIADPYRWLEDTESAETREWIEQQNRVTDAWLRGAGSREELQGRLTELWDFPKRGLPARRGPWWFQSRNSGLQNQSVIYVGTSADDDGRVLLDPNELSTDGTVAVVAISVCLDGSRVAYGLSEAGSDWVTWRVRDVASGEDLADVVPWSKFSDAAWLADGSGFYYAALEPPSSGREYLDESRCPRIQLHRIGTPPEDDEVVFAVPDDQPDWLVHPATTWDGRYLVVTVRRGTNRETMVLVADLTETAVGLRPLIDDFSSMNAVIEVADGRFLVRTDDGAERGRIVSIDPSRPDRGDWQEVVPEAPDVVGAATLCGGRLVAHYLHHGSSSLRVFDLDGTERGVIELPGLGTAGVQGAPDQQALYVSFTSFSDPGSIWEYDLESATRRHVWSPESGIDPAEFTTEQSFVTSHDGVQVPVFLTRRVDVDPTGEVPVLLTGYGGFNVPTTPGFGAARHLFVERGGLLATAILRGGGEYGTAWYEAGRLANKQNVFDDFCACAEWLGGASGWSRPDRIAILGGSNGGLLVGACLTQRPELFGAAVPVVGVLDLLRFHRFTIGWAWISDYGDPDDPEQFRWVRAYSPYHNIRDGVAYPPTLVMTGDHDDRVVPGHSFKFAAALQAAQAGDAPILIRVETSAGHGAGKPTMKAIAEQTDMLVFLDQTIGAPGPSGRAVHGC